jgi:glycerol 2-dehydrogenase (NADP+)
LPNGLRDVDHSWKLSDTWKQMEAMVKKGEGHVYFTGFLRYPWLKEYGGKVKTIGISNFSIKKMDEILPTAEIIPAVNQVR